MEEEIRNKESVDDSNSSPSNLPTQGPTSPRKKGKKRQRRRGVELQSSMQDPQMSVRSLARVTPGAEPEKLREDVINLKYGYVTLLREMRKRMPELPNIPVRAIRINHRI